MKGLKHKRNAAMSDISSTSADEELEDILTTDEKNKKSKLFIKKYGVIIFPLLLLLIACVILMTCLLGVRGVYVNVNNPNEFFNFSAGTYEYVELNGLLVDYSDAERGIWQPSDKKLHPIGVDDLYLRHISSLTISKVEKSGKYITVHEYGGFSNKNEYKKFRRVSLISYPLISKKLTVKIDVNGGNEKGYTKKIKMGNTIDYPDFVPTKSGYQFMGWYTDPYGFKRENGRAIYPNHRIWEDVTFYANWSNNTQYEVIVKDSSFSFQAQEGDLLLPTLQKAEDNTSYDYFLDGKIIDENTVMPPKNITITRQNPRERVFYIYFDANGGDFPVKKQVVSDTYSMVIGSAPTKEGFVFGGWDDGNHIHYLNGEFSWLIGSPTDRHDIYLKAIWLEPFEFTLKDGGYELTKCNALEWKYIIIPSSYNGLPVISIGDYAFSKNELSRYKMVDVTIPNTVTHIGKGAFQDSDYLLNVRIPDSVTEIDEDAFNLCLNLTSVVLSSSVTKLNSGVFSDCWKLKKIYFRGSISKWYSLEKADDWINGHIFANSAYVVICTDGKA